jgi:hypothetical protein
LSEQWFLTRKLFFENVLSQIGTSFDSADLTSCLASLRMAYGPIKELFDDELIPYSDDEHKYLNLLRLQFVSIEAFLMIKLSGVKTLEYMILAELTYRYQKISSSAASEYVSDIKDQLPDMWPYALYRQVCLISREYHYSHAA